MSQLGFNSAAREQDVTRAIFREWGALFEESLATDVVVVGAGPSGLVCARDLALDGARVIVVEGNNYLGGGFWIGGYLMNAVTVREPAQELLVECGVPMKRADGDGLWVTHGPHACAKLIAAACDAGVRFLNMTFVEDVVLRAGGRVEGVVVNWTPVRALPRSITCVDPVALEASVVVDATGHDAHVVKALANRGLMKLPGNGPMDVVNSEAAILERTGEVSPGLIAVGMAVAAAHQLPRMGPTFGAMLLSGRVGAQQAHALLRGRRQATPNRAPAVPAVPG